MWSPRSISSLPALRCVVLTALVALTAGCAVSPGARPAGEASPPAIPPAALTLYEQATAAMAAGEDVDAELRFSEFLLRYPDYPGAHVNLAMLQAKAGNDTEAEKSLSGALELAPRHAIALNQLGMLRRRQGRFSDADAAYRAAIAAEPNYALAHYNLAVLNELYLQRLPVALLHFEKFQELDGDDSLVAKWIVDLKRRIAANQRTANVTE